MRVQRILLRGVLAASVMLSAAEGILAADPGIPMPQGSSTPQVNDQARGFLLIYNIYTSSPSNAGAQNTRFSITNTQDQAGIAVHLFFVDGATCSIADRYVCLTPNQTMVFLASEQDPGTTGYLVAVATDSNGRPVPFDYLIGDAFVKFENGFFGNLGAEAIPAHNVNQTAVSSDGTLGFLGVLGLPRVLAVDSIGSRADGNDTLLVVNGVGGAFNVAANTIGSLFGILYNDQEEAHSWNRSGVCQIVAQLDNNFPRTAPRFDVVIPAGQTGWMKFWSTSTINNSPFGTSADGRGLLGAVFQRNATVSASSGAFQGARNLHKLTLVSINPDVNGMGQGGQFAGGGPISSSVKDLSHQLTIFAFPIFPNNCGFFEPDVE